jgi:hypothetical protein
MGISAWENWKNSLGDTRPWDFLDPKADIATDEKASERFDICRACPELIKLTGQCKKCGCMMRMKTKLEKAVCPIGKW